MMIGFPPCTDIATAGGSWFTQKRADGRQEKSLNFFFSLAAADIPLIALENPKGIIGTDYIAKHFPYMIKKYAHINMPRKRDQHIEPYYFGDPVKKYTCLWLKGLKPLRWVPENTLFERATVVTPKTDYGYFIRKGPYRTGQRRNLSWQDLLPKKDRAKIKSKTFPGIAQAMAEQWG